MHLQRTMARKGDGAERQLTATPQSRDERALGGQRFSSSAVVNARDGGARLAVAGLDFYRNDTLTRGRNALFDGNDR